MLFGRNPETTVLDDLLRAARDGESSVRSVRGAAGIGKTTLLDWASEHAEGFLVLRAIGIEAETRWPFGGLHLLLRPLMKRIDDLLPEPLAKGLHRALALDGGEAGSAANIGMAVLQLLAEASEERPILCVVDDAQWMDDDSAQALLFASRRLYAERVVFLWGVREGDARPFPTVGIDDLPVGPVDDESALELLSAASPGLNESVRRHIVRIAGGNPLALLELATAHREGRAGVDGFTSAARHSATSLRQSFSERIDALPEATKRLLLLAAAETTGDLALVLKAGALFGTTLEDLAPAEAKELISTSGDEIGFSHPLIRTAAYFGAPLKERARAHRALADSVGGPETGCRRVYHLASAAPGPDESIATDLARKAAEDAVRGGHAAEADTYELAAELSADPAAKVERLLLGAEAAHKAGQSAQALKLSESVVHSSNDPAMLHRAHQVQAVIANWNGDKDASARHWFRSFEQQMLHDPASAGYPLFNVVETAIQHGDFALARSATERGEEHGLEHAPWVRLLLRGGLGLNRSGGVTLAEGVSAVRELMGLHEPLSREQTAHSRLTYAWWCFLTGDPSRAYDHVREVEADCRDSGGNGYLAWALATRAAIEFHCAYYAEAEAHAQEATVLAAEVSDGLWFQRTAVNVLTQTAALRGDFAEARRLLEEIPADASATVEAFVLGCEQRWDEALPLLSKVHRSHLTMYAINFLPTLIEAAARTGKPEEAAEASDYLAAYAEATGEDWVRAVSLRSRALLEEDADTEGLFTEALDLHGGRGDSPLDHGLTHLAYGEWLRRVRRGNDAKEQIALALDRFDRIGAETAAQRARAELRAAGGRAPAVRRKSTAAQNLTPQEFQVAKLAATGLTNREIGSQLYLSPRTVGYHLYKAYPKLGVKTRTELAHLELG